MLVWSQDETSFSGEVEVDESYFGPRRIKGKHGRGAGKKKLVLGVLKRGGKVHTDIIRKASKKDILPILKGKVPDVTTIYTDG
jgi:transposase-like protein